jgi:hypothetical protein
MRKLCQRRIVFAVTLALALGSVRASWAQQPATLTFTVTENRVPGAAGTGTITPLPNNQIRVDVRLTGMQPNSEHAMHIHVAPGARCDNNAPVVYPLTSVMVDGAGVGTSTSTITLRPERPVQAGNAYINVHQDPMVPSPGVICANIDTTFAASAAASGAGSAGAPTPAGGALPRTGTGLIADTAPPAWLLAGLVGGLMTLLGIAAAGVRRRTGRPSRTLPRA